MVNEPARGLRWNTLAQQWALWVCVVIAGGFIFNSLGSYWVSRDNVRKTITESALPLTSDNIYSEIQRDLLKPVFISSVMATDTFLRDWILAGEHDATRIINYLAEIKAEYQTITAFLVSDRSRNYYHATQVLKQVSEDEPRDEWYYRVRSMKEPFEINVDIDLANHDAMTVFVNYRVMDYEGNFIGAAGVGLTLELVNQLMKTYENRYSRHILFADASGTIVLDTQGRKSSSRNLSDIEGLGSHAPEILSNPASRIRYKRDGSHFFLNSRFVPELGWYLIVEQTEDLLLAPLHKTLGMNLLIALITTIAVALLCLGSIRRHQRGLEYKNARLSQANEAVKEHQAQLEQYAKSLSEQNHQLESLNKEKDEFLGIVAHDLRSPLSGISGLCDYLKSVETVDNEELQSCLDSIASSTESMNDLIQNLAELRNLESTEKSRKLEPMHWNDSVRGVVARFRRMAQAKSIEFRTRVDPSCDITVPGRDSWMDSALGNLISNAVKYSPPNGWLEVATRRDATQLVVSVRDSGPGFLPSDLKRIFGKYERLSARPTAGESSTGLGLYIVARMAERLEIQVRVENHPEGGALFTLSKALGADGSATASD